SSNNSEETTGSENENNSTPANNSSKNNSEAESGSSEVIELDAVTAWPEDTKDNEGLFSLIDIVNEKGKGKVHINYLGGPETVPSDEQPKALKNGTMDILWTSANYNSSLVPAADSLLLSKMSPQEE